MTQNEFESLVGYKVSAEEYQYIEMVYMVDKDMDKREFCDIWKNLSEPARDMILKMTLQKDMLLKDAKVAIKTTLDSNSELLDIMFKRAQKTGDSVLRETCINRMGAKEYLRKMLSGGYSLWEDDKNLLIEILA